MPYGRDKTEALQLALLARAERRSETAGVVTLPCAPSLLEHYDAKLATLFETLGRPFSVDERRTLRQALERNLTTGFAHSPHTRLLVAYETEPPLHKRLKCRISTKVSSIAEEYDRWIRTREPPLFGSQPDARVMRLAADLGVAADIPVLDVGAGTGRNAIPLAIVGHPVDTVEPVAALSSMLRASATACGLSIGVYEGSVFDESLALPVGRYALMLLAEVVASHFRDPIELRRLAERAVALLAPGGVLLFNAFVATNDYEPDMRARELSQIAWSTIFTRHELERAFDGLPFGPPIDNSVHDYEREHLPPGAWPPTSWFEDWSLGRDIFDLPRERPPVEMRWLAYRRE